ncbi:hypothetical protein SNE40_007261 [Patella caerulea]|uniref:TM2 domain-containing protein n=1 Tax=Patella caerulea TaxID=87958 RepID=A0AAN8JTG4_PATCE
MSGGLQAQITITPIKAIEKSVVDAYILCFVLGLTGAHHLYLRRPWFFVAYLFTFGLLGVGWLVDMFRIPCLVKDCNERLKDASKEKIRKKVDAYLLWFPFGLLGFHLFYLRRPGQGLLYFFTFGLCGIGWLVDLFRIPYMTRDCNENPCGHQYERKSMFASYILCISPLGILGAHHYYLNRPYWGILYTLTFGLLGVGWVVDWFRCYNLVQRTREIDEGARDAGIRYMDDIYLLWFPLGWIGLHHFYLRRYIWGFIYFFTFGLLGVGWLIDFCRLPCLLKEHNLYLTENRNLTQAAQKQLNYGQVNTRTGGDNLVTTRTNDGVIMNQQPQQPYQPQQPIYYGSTVAPGVVMGPNFTQMPNTAIPYPQYPTQIVYVHPGQNFQPGYYQQPQQQSTSQQPIMPMPGAAPEHPPTYEEATVDKTETKQ